MTERHEGQFSGQYQDELFFQSWTRPKARATLILTHGLGEHSEAYAQTAESLVELGWNVMAWDLRGHGRSSGKRGYVKDFKDYVLDLASFVRFVQSTKRFQHPYALMGHSMGGLITLRYALEAGPSLKAEALLMSSPLLGIAVPIPPIKEAAAKFLRRIAPGVTLGNEIRYENLSRDPEVVKRYPLDSLRHDKICPAVYFGMLENIAYVRENISRLRKPILLQCAGTDKIVAVEASKELFPKIGSPEKKLLIYQESHHEIFNDFDREQAVRDLNQFLSHVMKDVKAAAGSDA